MDQNRITVLEDQIRLTRKELRVLQHGIQNHGLVYVHRQPVDPSDDIGFHLLSFKELELVKDLRNALNIRPSCPQILQNSWWCFLACVYRIFGLVPRDVMKLLYVNYVAAQYPRPFQNGLVASVLMQRPWISKQLSEFLCMVPCLDRGCFSRTEKCQCAMSKLAFEGWCSKHFQSDHQNVSFWVFINNSEHCDHIETTHQTRLKYSLFSETSINKKTTLVFVDEWICLLCGKITQATQTIECLTEPFVCNDAQ
jgi:hypothetical protein